ncbi:MAG: PDZ domain-containing protein [Candidatus Krumholzibacteriia bacterium]
MRSAFLTVLLILALAIPLQGSAAPQTLLLRQPDISAENLAFVYAGDIWVAQRDGSLPYRLTTSPADENSPRFSPDGALIAFCASYEGNQDVYVIPVEGGQPRRLTWHPGQDSPTGWTADGKAVAFVSSRETDHGRSAQLYHASLDGGLPVKQMEARIVSGAYDDAGSRLAYIAYGSGYNGLFGGGSGWKGYRGGTTPEIMIMDLEAGAVTTIPGAGTTNFNPVWLGDRLFFLSDRDDEIFNLFRYDQAGGTVTRITDEKVWDVRAAGGHGDVVVYESGGRLKSLDTTTGAVTEIRVSINPDLPQLRPQWKDASRTVQTTGISPTGKRVIVTARGEVFTVPVEDGSTRNLTRTGTRREYSALWSPGGDQVAYIADGPEGQSLVIEDQTGMDEARTFELGPYFYQLQGWSKGESGRIVFTDNHLSLYAIELDGGGIDKIATGSRREEIDTALSPDGRWLAFTQERPNFQRDLMLHEFATGRTVQITDGAADVAAPAFSLDGKYLFFAASTNSGPLQVGLNMTSQERPYRAGLYAAILAADGDSPLLPKSGDENEKDGDSPEGKDKDKKGGDDEDDGDKSDETRIDLEGIASRIVALPVAERNYRNLAAGKDGALYYVQAVQPGASNEPPGERASDENALVRFDFEDKEAESLMTGVNGFSISADGKHLLIGKGRGYEVAETGKKLDAKHLDLSGLKVMVDPREEWRLIFDETWRMEKEFFYDPDMHGLDWKAVRDRYLPLLDHVGRREDLNAVMVEMIAEMQVGHNRVGGGDLHGEDGTNTGLLGANFTLEDGRYKLARVYTGETWNPFVTAPLATPGNEAREGEYLLAVNGRDLTAADNVFEYLQGTAGTQVTLRVGPRADGRDARDITVEPVTSEREMRLWRWIEANRRRIDEATGGRVGYIYLPNTAGAGYTFFNRMFFAQLDKEALIIDERSNAGGQAANYIIEVLGRAHLSGWKDRDGLVYNTPAGAMHGPKVMLIDQDAGSGGDYLPYAFRQMGIGKLIGTRTWGGLIGISANPRLTDGGFLSVPFFRFYDADHEWTVENEGVAPDLHVPLDPVATNEGRDSQLEAAIAEVTAQLRGFENQVPTEAPPYPTELGK